MSVLLGCHEHSRKFQPIELFLTTFLNFNYLKKNKTEDLLRENLGGFKVENVPGSHQKERNGKNKNGNTQICSCEGEGKKKKKKSKDKDKQ